MALGAMHSRAFFKLKNETKDKRMLAWDKSLTEAMKVDKGEVRVRLLKLSEEMAEEFEKDDKEDDVP